MADSLQRRAALLALAHFCEREGFPVPSIRHRLNGHVVELTGESPSGERFGIGYAHG